MAMSREAALILGGYFMGALIGVRREDKSKWERRVPLTPRKMRELWEKYGVEFCVQPSPVRVFRSSRLRRPAA